MTYYISRRLGFMSKKKKKTHIFLKIVEALLPVLDISQWDETWCLIQLATSLSIKLF